MTFKVCKLGSFWGAFLILFGTCPGRVGTVQNYYVEANEPDLSLTQHDCHSAVLSPRTGWQCPVAGSEWDWRSLSSLSWTTLTSSHLPPPCQPTLSTGWQFRHNKSHNSHDQTQISLMTFTTLQDETDGVTTHIRIIITNETWLNTAHQLSNLILSSWWF